MVRAAGTGEADDAYASATGWGGDGDDGVFKLSHGELGHLDFLMVTGEKNVGVVEWCFCRAFCEKWWRRTRFLR